ncbi:MAG: hypothetical protein QF464_16340, partial [Myxococcota bacterium]|nr:hypothetical protein [Myxococcota bacterium]
MTRTQQIGAAVVVVALAAGGWWMSREPPAPKVATPAPAQAPPTKPKPPPPPPPKPLEVRVIESCEAARDYLAGKFEGALADTPLAPAQLSWDAGLTWAPGPLAPITEGAFHATPRQSVPVGEVALEVSKTERVQAAVALPGADPPDVAALIWAGLDAAKAERFVPRSEKLQAWEAYRQARLDLRVYRWNAAKRSYEAHRLFDGAP